MPALEFVGLDENYEQLISEFVPHIVNERDDGVAKFRENATKTNSLVDRLESLTLPVISILKVALIAILKSELKQMIF